MISLCVLALVQTDNEVAQLRHAIASAVPAVDEVLVVVDSRSCGVDLWSNGWIQERCPWPESFAKARNAIAEAASGEWILIVDADDYYQELGNIRELMLRAPAQVQAITGTKVCTIEGREVEREPRALLAYRKSACQWAGKRHNELTGVTHAWGSTAIYVAQYPSLEAQQHKRQQAMKDLKKEYHSRKSDRPGGLPRVAYLLARECAAARDWSSVAKWARRATEHDVGNAPEQSHAWALRAWAALNAGTGGWQGVATVVGEGLELYPAQPDLLHMQALLAVKLWETALQDPENPCHAGSVFSTRFGMSLHGKGGVCEQMGWPTWES